MVFLHSNGVGTARAVRIFRTYGGDAIALITENPYRLARDIHGIGFRTADTIAGKLGIEKTALIRARAGISYALTEAMDDGYCGLPREELLGLAEKLLEAEQPILLEALNLELREGSVVADLLDDEPDVVLAKLIRVVQERIPKRFGLDPIRDVQVLCPMNRGGLGARSVNLKLQSVLTPPGEKRVERFGSVYTIGDKVMQVENDYTKEVYNGDIGVVTGIDLENQAVSISFDGRDVAYDFGELDLVTLAYATTIHKSQGSEYPAVVIPLTTQHYPMLKRNLVYTAITRGRKLVVLIGQKKALAMAVKNDTSRRRYTKLRERLADRSTVST